jgi:hypothetical protein
VVKTTPWPLYPRKRPGTRCIEGLVGPRADVKNLASTGIQSLDRPECIESLYRLRRPSPPIGMHGCKWKLIILNDTLSPVFLILSTVEEFLKQFFISRGNITHGNVYRPRTRTSKHTHTHTQKAVSSTRILLQYRQ